MLDWLKTRQARARRAEQLYAEIVTAARRPAFYTQLGVADTVSGRFEVIVLHLFVVLERLNLDGGEGPRLARRLMEVFCHTMDVEFREMGVGDMGVPKKVRKVAEAALGRVRAYGAAMRRGDVDGLKAALKRNVYDDQVSEGTLAQMAAYLTRAYEDIADLTLDRLEAGQLAFPEPEFTP